MKAFLLYSLIATASLAAAPQAIVFDFGGVLTGEQNREAVIEFIQDSLQLSREEFEIVNREKRLAARQGIRDEEFWRSVATKRDIELAPDWSGSFRCVLREALGVKHGMFRLVKELKERQIRVGLLSNIDERLARIIREMGLYESFEPCLLSCEIGIEKPDSKAYEHLLAVLDLPAKDIVFIDDRVENIESAKTVGLDAILFKSEEQLRSELRLRRVSE